MASLTTKYDPNEIYGAVLTIIKLVLWKDSKSILFNRFPNNYSKVTTVEYADGVRILSLWYLIITTYSIKY